MFEDEQQAILQVKENYLQFKKSRASFFAPFILYRNDEDYFSA